MKTTLILLLMTTLVSPVNAQGLKDALTTGAGKVGDVAKKGANSVTGAVASTTELLSDEETPEETRAKLDKMENEVLARLLLENSEAARAQMRNPGKNSPVMSLKIPTKSGDTNIPMPPTVMNAISPTVGRRWVGRRCRRS